MSSALSCGGRSGNSVSLGKDELVDLLVQIVLIQCFFLCVHYSHHIIIHLVWLIGVQTITSPRHSLDVTTITPAYSFVKTFYCNRQRLQGPKAERNAQVSAIQRLRMGIAADRHAAVVHAGQCFVGAVVHPAGHRPDGRVFPKAFVFGLIDTHTTTINTTLTTQTEYSQPMDQVFLLQPTDVVDFCGQWDLLYTNHHQNSSRSIGNGAHHVER